jgi:putative transposase
MTEGVHLSKTPESNGMSEAFVKTFRRDYVPYCLLPNAAAALAIVENWDAL